MEQMVITPLLHIAIILPLLLIFMKERTRENYLRVLGIVVCYFIYNAVLTIQFQCDCLNIIKGGWNWDGKIYGVICGVAAYFIFRRQFSENDFLPLNRIKRV